MNLNEYQEKALETASHTPINHSCVYPALGLAGEAGEVLGKIKKVFRDKGGKFTDESRAAIADEIGDCIWYCAVLAKEMGYTLEQIGEMNRQKLESRKQRGVIKGDGDKR